MQDLSRHAHDKRIVILDSVAQLSLWCNTKERERLNIHGMICDLKIPSSFLKKISKDLERASRTSCWEEDYNLSPIERFISFKFEWGIEELSRFLEDKGLTEQPKKLITALAQLYRRAVQPDHYSPTLQVRINGDTSMGYHRDLHSDSLTLAFSRGGTICSPYRGNDRESINTSEEYQIPAGHVLLIDETVWHKAPDADDSWFNEPRSVLVI